ncbi:MAG TPA: aminotransferase class I/II-fold pyridoxal phosphate-dependent enzyme, partial [Frankiaceae bacterium]|nr:aminotransferase class I/II-fold pyridoxal phosphate-dependent enzyme [Frankiaceae bacterium]
LVEAVTEWAVDRDLWVMIDESYADLVLPPARHVHPVECRADAADRVVSVRSFSKSFSVTGWRVGYLYGPAPVVAAARSLQTHLTSHAPSVLQHALVPAAEGAADDDVEATVARIGGRLAVVEEGLAGLPELRWERPAGGFYLFLDCRALLGRTYHGVRVATTGELTERLVTDAGVAVTSGAAFGAEGYVRMSLTADEGDLAEACARIGEFVGHGR